MSLVDEGVVPDAEGDHRGTRGRWWRAATGVIVVVALIVGAVLFIRAPEPKQKLVAAADPTTTSELVLTLPPTTDTSVPPTTVPPTLAPTTVPVRTTVRPTAATAPPPLRFSGSNGSLSIEVTVTPGGGRTGDLLRFETKVTDAEGGLFATGGTYGDDGRMTSPTMHVTCAAGAQPPTSSATTTFVDYHAYRVAGVYRITRIAVSNACGREARRVDVTGSITIGQGRVLANGPQVVVPSAIPEPVGDRDASLVYLSANAIDRDGYVRKIVVDWGDGTPSFVMAFPMSECQDPVSRFPDSDVGKSLSHRYASPGAKTVTVTATSSGCNGADVQTASAQEAVTAP